MSDAWREGWGYSSAAPKVSGTPLKDNSELAPKTSKHSRWAKMSEIQGTFSKCELNGKDTVLENGGFPVWSDGSVAYVDSTVNHVMIVAATNRHKTRGALMPTIAVTAMEKNVSYVIHDPKGELYRYLSGLLRSRGIDVRVVNFRDPECGDCWNMLSVPYRLWKAGNKSAAKSMLTDIAALLSPIDIKTTNDVFWPSAGQYTLLGFLYALMELSDSEDEANFSNLVSIIRSASVDSDSLDRFAGMFDKNSDVVTMLTSAMNNGDTTRKCIMGMVYNSLAKLICNESLASMMASNQIDLSQVGVKPTEVFLITPDEKNTYNPIVGQFVSQAYQELIAKAQSLGGRLPMRVNFLLDEFASLDRIEGIPDMLAAGRSRNIRCMIVIQSVAQLKYVYGDISDSIMNNCADWVYLGGRDTEFMDLLCKLAGTGADGQSLVTTTQLMHLEKGREAFVLIDGAYPFIGRIADISEYDIGDLVLEDPGRRTDHRSPVLVGDRIFDRGKKEKRPFLEELFGDPEPAEDRKPFSPIALGPFTAPDEIDTLVAETKYIPERNRKAVAENLMKVSQSLEVSISGQKFLVDVATVNDPDDLTMLISTLDLKSGVRPRQFSKLLAELRELLN